jgi:hypothetical protein
MLSIVQDIHESQVFMFVCRQNYYDEGTDDDFPLLYAPRTLLNKGWWNVLYTTKSSRNNLRCLRLKTVN